MGMTGASVLTAVVLLALPAAAQRQSDEETADDTEKSDRIQFDFSFDYDPAELREHWDEKIRVKRIWGPIGVAGYHIFPAAESGPWARPPTRIWTNGFGTSLWRDPITGWPEQ